MREFYLRRGVLQYDRKEGERSGPPNRRVGDEGGPVPVQSPFLHTFHHREQTVQRALPHTTVVQPGRLQNMKDDF